MKNEKKTKTLPLQIVQDVPAIIESRTYRKKTISNGKDRKNAKKTKDKEEDKAKKKEACPLQV